MKNHKVYILIDPRDGEIRYVGRTQLLLKDRLSNHIHSRNQYTRRAGWINELLELGLKPDILMIQDCGSDMIGVDRAEEQWIRRFSLAGCQLFNGSVHDENIMFGKKMPRPEWVPLQYGR